MATLTKITVDGVEYDVGGSGTEIVNLDFQDGNDEGTYFVTYIDELTYNKLVNTEFAIVCANVRNAMSMYLVPAVISEPMKIYASTTYNFQLMAQNEGSNYFVILSNAGDLATKEEVNSKQDKLTEGTDIKIVDNVIDTKISLQELQSDIDTLKTDKQNILTAGENITIDSNGTISAADGQEIIVADMSWMTSATGGLIPSEYRDIERLKKAIIVVKASDWHSVAFRFVEQTDSEHYEFSTFNYFPDGEYSEISFGRVRLSVNDWDFSFFSDSIKLPSNKFKIIDRINLTSNNVIDISTEMTTYDELMIMVKPTNGSAAVKVGFGNSSNDGTGYQAVTTSTGGFVQIMMNKTNEGYCAWSITPCTSGMSPVYWNLATDATMKYIKINGTDISSSKPVSVVIHGR